MSLIACRRLQRETLHKRTRGNGLFPDWYYIIHCGLFGGGGGVVIEQVSGKILPPFHERLQALVDQYEIRGMTQAKNHTYFPERLEALYMDHNRDLVIDFLVDSVPRTHADIQGLIAYTILPVKKKIWEDFEDYWYCGTNEEVVAAGSKYGDVDPLEPAKDLAEMRAKDVIKEARG